MKKFPSLNVLIYSTWKFCIYNIVCFKTVSFILFHKRFPFNHWVRSPLFQCHWLANCTHCTFSHIFMILHNEPLWGPFFIVIQQNLNILEFAYMCMLLDTLAASIRREQDPMSSMYFSMGSHPSVAPLWLGLILGVLGWFFAVSTYYSTISIGSPLISMTSKQ